MTFQSTFKTIPNKFPGNCTECDRRIEAGSGFAYKDPQESKWGTICRACKSGELPTPEVATPFAERPTFPLTDEQIQAVALFESGQSLAIQAGAGCLAADTIININRGGKGFQIRIDRLANSLAGIDTYTRTLNGKPVTQRTPGWDLSIPTLVARAQDDVIRLGTVRDAWASGVKETFILTTTTGREIRATAEHPFLTAEGEWAKLGLLRTGDAVQVNSGHSQRGRGTKPQYRYLKTVFHPNQAHDSGNRFKVPEHRLVVEADLNGLTLSEFLYILRNDELVAKGLIYLGTDKHVHHEDHDTKHNDLTNLIVLDIPEHHRHHAAAGNGDHVLLQVGIERILSVIPYGEEPTYDIEVTDDPHNFIANGFVVHNTGKTSTLIAIAKSTNRNGQYIAFNKTIATEAALKFAGTNCSASSFHSLAFQAVGKRYAKRLNSARQSSREIARQLHIEPFFYTVNGDDKVLQPATIAGYVFKAISNFCISSSGRLSTKFVPIVDGIDEIIDGQRRYDNQRRFAAQVFPYVEDAWSDILNENGTLRFTHDHYFKIWELGHCGKPIIPGDYILFDEAQDATPVFISVVEQQEKQVIWVGDSQQAIYEWRGAVNALDNVATEATTFLTNSFRFGPQIADVANQILAQIETAELRIVGRGAEGTVAPIEVPEVVLTRTNAGAISVVLDYLSRNRTVFLLGGGGEVESFAKAARELQQNGTTEHPELAIFSSWGEVQEYVSNDPQGSELRLLVKLIDDHGVAAILRAVQNTVSEEDADVVVTTAHKSKGREWDSVRIHSDFPEERQDDGERRLLYVAVTRAKLQLDIESCAPLQAILNGEV